MRIDVEVLKRLTGVFLESEEPLTTWFDLREALPNVKDTHLAWYLDLLHDDGFLMRVDRKPGTGVNYNGNGTIRPSTFPLRLTSQGMSFAANLHRSEAIKWLERSLRDVKHLSLQLLSGSLQQWAASGFPLPSS
ncbi:MAG: hypothetical protein AAGF92_15000 [Myxococcota bacterium]